MEGWWFPSGNCGRDSCLENGNILICIHGFHLNLHWVQLIEFQNGNRLLVLIYPSIGSFPYIWLPIYAFPLVERQRTLSTTRSCSWEQHKQKGSRSIMWAYYAQKGCLGCIYSATIASIWMYQCECFMWRHLTAVILVNIDSDNDFFAWRHYTNTCTDID